MMTHPLLPPDEMTWADQLLGLDPRLDPRVRSGMLHPDELDLLAEQMWEAGIEPTETNAGPYLAKLRTGIQRAVRELGPQTERNLVSSLWTDLLEALDEIRANPRHSASRPSSL